jgi:hypothetical protein
MQAMKTMTAGVPSNAVIQAAADQVADIEAAVGAAMDIIAASNLDPAVARKLGIVLCAASEAADSLRETLAAPMPTE